MPRPLQTRLARGATTSLATDRPAAGRASTPIRFSAPNEKGPHPSLSGMRLLAYENGLSVSRGTEMASGRGKRGSSMWRTCLAAVTLTTCLKCMAVAQSANVEIGVLTCVLGEPADAPSGDAETGGQTRDALCTFQPGAGADEEYIGKVQGVSMSADQRGTLIWSVKSASAEVVPSGALQQTYANDPSQSADQKPPLIGQANPDIVLHSMADASEGSASATEKPAPTAFLILGVELKLKSASG